MNAKLKHNLSQWFDNEKWFKFEKSFFIYTCLSHAWFLLDKLSNAINIFLISMSALPYKAKE